MLQSEQDQPNRKKYKPKLAKIILGSTELGSNVSKEVSRKILYNFINSHNLNEKIFIDTSFVYGRGESEKSLSMINDLNINPIKKSNILISTKVHALKGLDKNGVNKQFNISLNRMNIRNIDILYIHQPSLKYDILETLIAINELYINNKIRQFGLCNFPAWMVCEVIYLCKIFKLILPTVYQGRYNPIRREVETELIPCIRHFGLSFYAFSPLARGILTGKHKYNDLKNNTLKSGKFTFNGKKKILHFYDYWKQSYFDGVDIIKNVIQSNNLNISLIQATYSWLLYHSVIDANKGDAIIFGCSKLQHVLSNIDLMRNAPLLDDIVVNAFEDAWNIAKRESDSYFRPYEKVRNIIKNPSKL